MTSIKGLLFDKDGTLFDFSATWATWAESFLLKICDGDRTEAHAVGEHIGFDLNARAFDPDSIVIAGTPQEVAETLLPHLPGYTMERLIDILNQEAVGAPQREAVPLGPLLDQLRDRGLALGVATNDAEAPARAHLSKARITEKFDFIAGFDSGHGGKPAPGQMFAFAAATGLDPANIAMIGDSTHDLHAGRAAGMICVGVLTGLAGQTELAPWADIVLPDIGHLPAWLDSLNG